MEASCLEERKHYVQLANTSHRPGPMLYLEHVYHLDRLLRGGRGFKPRSTVIKLMDKGLSVKTPVMKPKGSKCGWRRQGQREIGSA